jgi:hypothetical protein
MVSPSAVFGFNASPSTHAVGAVALALGVALGVAVALAVVVGLVALPGVGGVGGCVAVLQPNVLRAETVTTKEARRRFTR